MGLDMYLTLVDKETKEEIEYSYYRKFNALQGYFEQNDALENGGVIQIDAARANEIYQILNKVCIEPDRASELLPTQSGFFYGPTDYDQLYFRYVELAEKDFYHAKYLDYDRYDLYFTSNW